MYPDFTATRLLEEQIAGTAPIEPNMIAAIDMIRRQRKNLETVTSQLDEISYIYECPEYNTQNKLHYIAACLELPEHIADKPKEYAFGGV